MKMQQRAAKMTSTSKSGVRHGSHTGGNQNSQRRNKPTNAGTRTAPLKGPDHGCGGGR